MLQSNPKTDDMIIHIWQIYYSMLCIHLRVQAFSKSFMGSVMFTTTFTLLSRARGTTAAIFGIMKDERLLIHRVARFSCFPLQKPLAK